MRAVLRELCDLLGEQKSVLEDMLALAREKSLIIISGDASKLEDVVRRELKTLSKLNSIEKRRLALSGEIAAQLGLGSQELNVTAIAGRAEPDERLEIRRLQAELTALLKQHSDQNRENKDLINAHFEYSEALMEIAVGFEDPLNNYYGGDGKAAAGRKKITGVFDSRA